MPAPRTHVVYSKPDGAAVSAKVQSARSAYSAVVEAALGNVGVLILEGSLCVSLVLVCASLQVQTAQLVAASIQHASLVPALLSCLSSSCGALLALLLWPSPALSLWVLASSLSRLTA